MDTLIATTARTVTFSHNGQPKQYPAGTEVYAKMRDNGYIQIRVPGTLWKQDVRLDSLIVP